MLETHYPYADEQINNIKVKKAKPNVVFPYITVVTICQEAFYPHR